MMYFFLIFAIALALIYSCVRLRAKTVKDMRDAGAGPRTRFVIDTADNGYTNYLNAVEEWLWKNKWQKKGSDYILKYHDSGNTYTFGFAHHQEGKNMVIEAWVKVLGAEYPLCLKEYKMPEGQHIPAHRSEEDIKAAEEQGVNWDDIPIAIGHAAKVKYLELLRSFLEFEDGIELKPENEFKATLI